MPKPINCFFNPKLSYRLSFPVHRITGTAGCTALLLMTLTMRPNVWASEPPVMIHPSLPLQIEAVLDYYLEHGLQDPLCQGEHAKHRQIALKELNRLLASPPIRVPFPAPVLGNSFDSNRSTRPDRSA